MWIKKYWRKAVAGSLQIPWVWQLFKWLLDWHGRIDSLAESYREIGGFDAVIGYILNPPILVYPFALIAGLLLIWWDSRRLSKFRVTTHGKIEICLNSMAPYETSEILHGQTLSIVRVGLKNSGGGPLSNIKVFIDGISPMPDPFYGGLPILLDGSRFTLRPDDPERFVDVASQWSNDHRYRFHGPTGFFAETLNYIDDNMERKIIIKITSSECQKSALFKIWTDESKLIHLKYLSDSS